MWRHVDPVWTDVSEERVVFIFRVENPRARNQLEQMASHVVEVEEVDRTGSVSYPTAGLVLC
jgi:hypothetical protein